MNLFGIEINAQNVALAFTIVFLIFVVLNGFLGFLRGSKKSIFYLIVTAVVFGLGFGLMLIAISALMKMPVGKWLAPLVSNAYPEITATSSMEDIVLGIITHNFPQFAQAVQEGSVTASFVLGIVAFAVKLVYIIVLLILAFTLFKLIADIIWLIIRPKKKDGIRPKKTFGGRMIGFGIGAFKGAVYSLLIFTLIAGVASIATSAMAVAETTTSNNNTEAVLVLSEGKASLITLDANEGSNNSSGSLFGDVDMDFLAGIVGAYRKSVPGAMFGAIKVSSVPFDEFLFDGVFSFDVQMGDEKVKVKLRSEIESVANAFAKVANEFDLQNPSLEAILSIGDEGEAALKGLVDAISDLKILKVAIPVALEIGMYGDFLKDEEGESKLKQFFTPDQIPELTNALLGDIKSIGYSFVDARKVIAVFVGNSEEEKDINTFLNLDSDAIKLLFDQDHLGGLDTVDILAPIGITYLTTIENVKTALDEFGLDLEQLTSMPAGATWSGEISKLGDVYIALQDLLRDPETGRVFIDKDNYAAILDLFTEEKINNFVDTLFTSNLVNNAAGGLVTFAKEKLLPEEYKQYITIGDDIKFDANECKAFLNAATCLVQSGFLNMFGEEGSNIADMIDSLDVDDLAKYLSQSAIIRSSLSGSLDLLLSNLSTGDMQLRFGTFEDWDDAASTEVELRSVLKAFKILGKNLFNSEGENTGFSINTLTGLTEAELEAILTSKIMRGTIVNFLVDNSGEGQTLSVIGSGVARVNANPDDWYDQYRIQENASLEGNILRITPSNTTIDQDYLVSHYVVYCNGSYLTSVRCVAGEAASVDLSTVKVGKDSSGNPIYHVPSSTNEYIAYGVNARGMGVESYTLSGSTLEINPAYVSLDNKNGVDKFNVYADGELIYSVRINTVAPLNINLSTIKLGEDENHNPVYFELKEDTKIEVYGYNEGELRKIFIAILSITSKLGDGDLDFSNTDSLTSALSKVEDSDIENITASVVINDALITAIEDLSKQDSPFIYVPMELKDNAGNVDHDKWHNADESANILKAIKAIFNGGNVNADNLKIKPIVDSKDTILKSLVICETIKRNIVNIEGINIPANEGLSTDTLDGWKNTYNSDGSVAIYGELSVMLDAITKVITITDETSINNISTDSLKLKSIIDNRDEILKSKVISETIRTKLLEVEGINIPTGEELSTTDLTGWKNIYNLDGSVASHGELSNILKAISYVLNITDDTTIDGISTDALKIKSIIDNRDEILKSLVISETIRTKLLEVEGIDVPENEGLSKTGLTGWKNTYNVDGSVATSAELSALLNAVNIVLNVSEETTINNINTNDIKLKNVIDNKDVILKSLVISEIIRTKLLSVEGIEIPDNEGLSNTDLTGWKNTYDNGGNLVGRAELSYLLASVGIVLDIEADTTINNIDTNNIKLKNVIDNRDEILKSKVICGTIKTKLLEIKDIDIPGDEGLSNTDLTGWKNTYKSNGDVDIHGEISKLLYSLNFIIAVDEDTTISSINTNSIRLKALITHTDEVLRSIVLTNTIKVKLLAPSTGITFPANEGLSETNLTGWKNIYNADETVYAHGEIDSLLKSVNYILDLDDNTSIDTLNVSTIKLQRITSNRDDILRSVVITNTIKNKLLEVEGINIPSDEGLGETDLTGWKNTYNVDESLASHGEISHILGAVELALDVNENTTLDSLSTNDIKIKKLITNRDEILKSLVLSDTIRVKLNGISGVSIPTGDGISATSLEGWKNTYNENGEVTAHGEMSRLLAAIDIMFAPTNETNIDGMNVDTISLKHIIDNRVDILKSLVLSDTIRVKICDPSTGVSVPNELSTTNLTGWKNTYNEEEYATEYGEINYLLAAIDEILHPTDSTKLNNISVNIKLGDIIDGKVVILHSQVISETIKTKIIEASASGTLKLPKNYAVNESPNYITWGNTYSDSYNDSTHVITTTNVTSVGELDYLLTSVGDLLKPADRDKAFDQIGALDYAKLFDPNYQEDIVSSRIISETIINRLEGVAALSIPNSTHINLKSLEDRTDWWDTETGEIIYFLNSVGSLLTDEQKSNLDSFNLDINTVYTNLTDEDARTVLLKSYVISDTLRVNFMNADALSTVPTVDNAGVDLANDLDAWYLISADRTTVSHKELWNMISSIKLLLGDDFNESKKFNLDDLLNNEDFVPVLDANKVNSNTNIHTFLQSKMIEQAFVDLAKSILTGDGVMADYINAPYGDYVWYEHIYTTNYSEDDRYEYDLQTVLESLYEMNAAGLNYTAFSNPATLFTAFSSIDKGKVADAFVISRTFKSSIAYTFNKITYNMYAFDQNDYNGTKAEASANLKAKLDSIF